MAAGVDGDTDRGSQLAGDSCFLSTVRSRVFCSYVCCKTRTFNSVRVKPRPARTRRLYLIVGHRTIGLNLSTGRGATAAAFERRALRRLSFRPGCIICQILLFILHSSCVIYLVEMNSDSSLPILSEICSQLAFLVHGRTLQATNGYEGSADYA